MGRSTRGILSNHLKIRVKKVLGTKNQLRTQPPKQQGTINQTKKTYITAPFHYLSKQSMGNICHSYEMHTPAYLLAMNQSKVVYLIASTISHIGDSLL
jgi:hypothetical protein